MCSSLVCPSGPSLVSPSSRKPSLMPPAHAALFLSYLLSHVLWGRARWGEGTWALVADIWGLDLLRHPELCGLGQITRLLWDPISGAVVTETTVVPFPLCFQVRLLHGINN